MLMVKTISPAALKSFEVFQLQSVDDDLKNIIELCTNLRMVTNEESAADNNIWSLVMNDSSDESSDNDLLCYLDEIKEVHSGFEYRISRDKVTNEITGVA